VRLFVFQITLPKMSSRKLLKSPRSKFVCLYEQLGQWFAFPRSLVENTENSLLPLTSHWFQTVKAAVALLIIVQHNIKWLGTIGGWVVVYVLYWLHYWGRTWRKITTSSRVWRVRCISKGITRGVRDVTLYY